MQDGPEGPVDSRLAGLYQRAAVCRAFPAYKLEDLGPGAPARDLLRAIQLLDIAAKANS